MTEPVITRSKPDAPDWNGEGAVLLVDKPLDWTSFDVVKKIRGLFGIRKIGHAGTLDPKASGLLIVCTGPRTKDASSFADLGKVYTGSLELGIVTPSFDGETEIGERRSVDGITDERVRSAVRGFLGLQLQTPPMYSAAKYGGKPLYTYARRGETVIRSPKEIEVTEFAVTGFNLPFVEFRVLCSKGTYVRSLVHDLGEALGCGAVLRMLRRSAIGPYHVDEAFGIEDLIALRDTMKDPLKSYARRAPAT